jgi:hypothetical protein
LLPGRNGQKVSSEVAIPIGGRSLLARPMRRELDHVISPYEYECVNKEEA